ncbi:serine palmitoyltransferase 1 [Apis mellifera caucasica]|uniref:Serine palmitoyltransferase 1 n=1 Tax=Apis mellifera TaxID=7460 RepID=A0A7M7RAB4_APIME|nr:serine palmitoyltransferase 1 [Apis mellifera]KAG6803815.1 serine palmitoyltransferase 1 [Apis mellifera caucasica]KAG9430757.1 serine palmitoyltransferase 1 [Apis mellifera carnica]|eukprot:XP_624768.1 serine palmitoyltransferase 1 [Apis mellifera]
MSTKFIFIESMNILSIIPQYHILIKTFFIILLIWFISKKYYNSHKKINEDEVEKKLAEWKPEPLINNPQTNHLSLNPRCITSRAGKRIVVDGKDCLNLGTHNYLGLIENHEIEENAIAAIRKYGVGSCGPRGFYGTVDVHLELEERLANYTDTEDAVVYSYGFSTIASAIAAYCKRKDLVYVDEKVNFAIQKGLDATKANIIYFKHNDVNDLCNLLIKQANLDKQNPKKAAKTKRFLIVEGIYMNTGNICPLPELVILCRKYKLRIFIDESISFGTLGEHGKGITEYFDIPRHEIDMIMGSLDWAMGSIGGFCIGTSFIIEHQRLSGLGYCFSASLPPLLTSAAITSLDIMENNPQIFKSLRDNCIAINDGLQNIHCLECLSFPESPVKHIYLKNRLDRATEEKLLSKISDKCIENNLAVITPAYLEAEKNLPRPSLRLCISTLLNKNDIDFALHVLKKCAEEILSI